MQVQLKQPELEEAISLYLKDRGLDLNGKSLTVKFAMTRKPVGISADVQIEDSGSLRPPTAVKPQPLRVARAEEPAAPVVAEAKPEDAPVDEAKQDESVPQERKSSLFAG